MKLNFVHMKTINVKIYWADKNYCCGWSDDTIGTIICTHKTLEGVKLAFEESLDFHMEGMAADGDIIPIWYANKEYAIEYELEVSALLRSMEAYTTMAAISRVTGINQKQLSHYASSLKTPKLQQRERIIEGLHRIGEKFLAIR